MKKTKRRAKRKPKKPYHSPVVFEGHTLGDLMNNEEPRHDISQIHRYIQIKDASK